LPDVPEPPPPTNKQLAQLISKSSTDIAYGTVTGETGYGAEFRVIHVYRGKLAPGQVIRPAASWGFNPPPCSGMISPPPAFQGMYGVIAYEGEPKLSFIPEDVLKEMFDARLISSARAAQRP
jgi:hypothetical protein